MKLVVTTNEDTGKQSCWLETARGKVVRNRALLPGTVAVASDGVDTWDAACLVSAVRAGRGADGEYDLLRP